MLNRYSNTAQYYDLIYEQFREFENELAELTSVYQKHAPNAESILDVACGTAFHLERLASRYDVVGVDIDPAMLEVAKTRIGEGRAIQADMKNFNLNTRFDIIQCLASSIGYLRSIQELHDVLVNFRRHLTPQGLLILEPWADPSDWVPPLSNVIDVESKDFTVSRKFSASRDGEFSKLTFEYSISDKDGTHQEREEHQLRLTSHKDLILVLKSAGFQKVELVSQSSFKKGLILGWICPE